MKIIRRSAVTTVRRCLGSIILLLAASSSMLRAAVTNVGTILNPLPAGGGNVMGSIVIGDSAFGSVTVTGGTAVSTTATTIACRKLVHGAKDKPPGPLRATNKRARPRGRRSSVPPVPYSPSPSGVPPPAADCSSGPSNGCSSWCHFRGTLPCNHGQFIRQRSGSNMT